MPTDDARASERLRKEVLPYVPEGARDLIVRYLARAASPVPDEIRLRVMRPLHIVVSSREIALDGDGRPTAGGGVIVGPSEILRAVELVTGSSVYALQEQLRMGFVTIPGGHRIGLSGTAVVEGSRVRGLRDFSGVNYRLAQEVRGACSSIIPLLLDEEGAITNTLIVSPPGCGKTTLLRDIIRCVSDGDAGARPCRVCLVDERSEVSASSGGLPGMYLGARTDVLDACPKAHGIMMGIRSLSPEVVATDELGGLEDSTAVAEAVRCGVRVIATVHAGDLPDALRRPAVSASVAEGCFDRFVVLSRRFGPGTIETVTDASGLGVSAGVRQGRGTRHDGPGLLGSGADDRFELRVARSGAG
ncbi:MAG: stage III sporulation protein AA [Firmicutes bacterium]|jgi:stage III sporulation protein AA|nr:stage III sporulation protein AA [Bacillota bacterium]